MDVTWKSLWFHGLKPADFPDDLHSDWDLEPTLVLRSGGGSFWQVASDLASTLQNLMMAREHGTLLLTCGSRVAVKIEVNG